MTFTTPYVTVDGIASAIATRVEYTSGPVSSAYYNAIEAFLAVLELGSGQSVTATNVNSINSALKELNNLMQYGLLISSTGKVTLLSAKPTSAQLAKNTYSLVTMSMAQDYNSLLLSLATVGINVNSSNLKTGDAVSLTQLTDWSKLAQSVSAISNTVQAAALDGYSGSQTLQSMLLVDYIHTGNNVIAGNLSSLNSALNITQNVIGSLTKLQNLHNQITTSSGTFTFNLSQIPGTATSDLSAYEAAYIKAASAFFNAPVVPTLISGIKSVGDVNTKSALISFVQTYNALAKELKQLSAAGPASALTNSNSLYSSVKQIIADMDKNNSVLQQLSAGTITLSGLIADIQAGGSNTTTVKLYSGFKSWMLDNYSAYNNANTSLSGKFSQDITFGITAAENLNDTQTASVQNYMYVFQEYYQSASAAIQAISSILTQMAQNIAR